MTPRLKRSLGSIAMCLICISALTFLDLWTKQWAVDNLSMERTGNRPPVCAPDQQGRVSMQRVRTRGIVLIKNFLEFRYAENCGAAFGILDDASWFLKRALFIAAAMVAVVALMWMYIRGNGGKLFALSVPLVISGALGNLIDRIQHVYVVDFIRFHIHQVFEWPTFNVADSAITVGVILLLLDGFIKRGNVSDRAES